MDGLEKEVKAEDSTSDRYRQLSEAKAQLASALEKYTADHPDVVRLRHLVDSLQKQVGDEAAVGAPMRAEMDHADNPAYIQVKGELDALMDDYEKRLAQSPEVERQYRSMARELESAQLKYQEMLSKQTEVQVSQNLETERKGERFTLIEPPQPPEKPISPNRPLLLVMGVFLSLACGAGAVTAREAIDASVRGPGDIRQLLRVPALASIPVIVTREDRARRRRVKYYSWASGFVVLISAVASVHFFVRPLDVVWLTLLRRFGV